MDDIAAVVRLLIAEDQEDVREAIAQVVGADSSFELVATASTADEAVVFASQLKPDLALVGVQVDGGGVRAAIGIRTVSPQTRVLALSGPGDPDTVSQMLQAGALGYFLQGTPARDLLAGLHRAAQGEVPAVPETRREPAVEWTDDELDSRLKQRWISREAPVREVIDGHLLLPVFQPAFDLRDRRIVGVEALARIGTDSPLKWFSEAADVGLLPELELEAIRRAFSVIKLLPAPAFLAVNLSPSTILTGAVDALVTTRLHGRLVIEVAEHALVRDYAELQRALAPLRAKGVRLAVDDFGSGASSLRHVLKLEPDIVKLDIKLTRNIHQNLGSQAIAAGLIAFAQRTRATVVAEGIETEAELLTLTALGATIGQGYLLAKPMVAAALGRLIARPRPPVAQAT